MPDSTSACVTPTADSPQFMGCSPVWYRLVQQFQEEHAASITEWIQLVPAKHGHLSNKVCGWLAGTFASLHIRTLIYSIELYINIKMLSLCLQYLQSQDTEENWYSDQKKKLHCLTFRHRAFCILGQAFHYFPENAFYIFNQQIYFIIWYLLDRASLI